MINNKILIFYSQLFGEEDPDQDVSPDTADPEAAGGLIHQFILISQSFNCKIFKYFGFS